ncbi:MAG: YjbQ family protein [Candidatus Liptonbacteria bacterium]|nr:YjbQ family protein [Candidatus Liptonbacteria bacterium]
MITLAVTTKEKKEVVDITDRVVSEIQKAGFATGLCHLFLTHTTAALTTADLDPGTDLDMLNAFEAMIPKHANSAPSPDGSGNANAPMRIKYRHPHNPAHVPDHILSSLIGTSLLLPVRGGNLVLGDWQRVVLIEFDGPREREVRISWVAGA